jgi:hypothetical protein
MGKDRKRYNKQRKMFKAGTEIASAEAACLNPGNKRGKKNKMNCCSYTTSKMDAGWNEQ